jgi:tRNA-dihydrouridine synthase B
LAEAVTVHGRTREDYYSGKADWDIIKRVKESVDIPVIGNGDIFNPEDAVAMFDKTDCDGIMIARGAQGNPWLTKRTLDYLKQGDIPNEPDFNKRIDMALKHLRKAIDYYGADIAIPRMRKHLVWYIKGLPYSSNIKERINQLKDYCHIRDLFKEYQEQITDYVNNRDNYT